MPSPDGSMIEALRRRLGIGSEGFAIALGVSRTTLYRWEAEGFVQGVHAPVSARLLLWMLGEDFDRHDEIGALIRRELTAKRFDGIVFLLCQKAARKAQP
jgi:transcriptional regulator with XRE-family HTH domain